MVAAGRLAVLAVASRPTTAASRLQHYRRLIEQPSYVAHLRDDVQGQRCSTTALCIAARLSARLRAVAAAAPRVANLCLDRRDAAVLDVAAGAHLCVAGAAAAARADQRRWRSPSACRTSRWRWCNNLAGTLIGMVHIMLPFLVLPVLGDDARDRPRLPQGGAEPRREPGARVLDGVLSAVAARPVRRRADRVHALPRLLRDARGARRRQGHHGGRSRSPTTSSSSSTGAPPARWASCCWC